jgi:hypothetical protein
MVSFDIVLTLENVYLKMIDQTFGVDLEARARADRKRVPMIITALLTFLDHRMAIEPSSLFNV